MKKRDQQVSALKQTVERQSGALRALSIAMNAHAENASLLTPSERGIIVNWSELIREVADELVRVLAVDETSRLNPLLQVGRALVAPLAFVAGAGTTGAMEGVVGAIAESWLTPEIGACANTAYESLAEKEYAQHVRVDKGVEREATSGLSNALLTWRVATRTPRRQAASWIGMSGGTWLRLERGDQGLGDNELRVLHDRLRKEIDVAYRSRRADARYNSEADNVAATEQLLEVLVQEMYQRNMVPSLPAS